MRPRFQIEDDRRDIARLGRSEQVAQHRCIGLGNAAIEFICAFRSNVITDSGRR
jgi:hypothetical protein